MYPNTGFSPQGMSPVICNCSPMGAMGSIDAMASGMQQQLMMMMMSMLSSLFQGAFGGGAQNTLGGLPATPSFGAGSGGGGGLNNFLGGPAGAKASKARATDGRQTKASRAAKTAQAGATAGGGKAAAWGKKLADYAKSHGTGSGGYCFRYVGQALRKFGVQTSGASAYMAGPQLAKSNKFREVKMSPSQLKKLPPGAVVVWNRGNGHQHGHISIALGGGKEVSDVPRDQITNYGTSVRVFLPK